jgi:Protein of unknown function (DUF295)
MVKINGLSNYVLFLDNLAIESGISIAATESTGLRRNCIYYIECNSDDFEWDDGIYRYDMEDGRSQKFPCPCSPYWMWFLPNLVSLLPSG